MKHAQFTYKAKYTEINGSVTLRDNGKVSVSLHNAKYGTTMNDRYMAKKLGREIAAADFKHVSITSLKISESSSKLIVELTAKTQLLKKQFIASTKKYAKNYFKYCEKQLLQTDEQWYKQYKVQYEYRTLMGHHDGKLYCLPVSAEHHKRNLNKMHSAKKKAENLIEDGYKKFEASEVCYAELHYTNSIQKLASRLRDKGLTEETTFKITSASVKKNIEITIVHNKIITKAWTIIAEGPIQRPHYRYLVK